jgi:hypothetical protein
MIIGLSGYAQSGKDTVAGMLIGLHGYDNRAFATPMRSALYTLNPVVTQHGDRLQMIVDIHGWEYAKKYTDARRLLQVFGTEIGREMFGEGFWVQQAFKGLSSSNNIVFTDVRFPNEAEMIKLMMGEVWRVERPGYAPINEHPSESSMDGWEFDRIIHNNSGLDSLKEQVKDNLADALVKYEQVKLANVL